ELPLNLQMIVAILFFVFLKYVNYMLKMILYNAGQNIILFDAYYSHKFTWEMHAKHFPPRVLLCFPLENITHIAITLLFHRTENLILWMLSSGDHDIDVP
ncbi:hypothetical protein ACJX0J_023386, partial [Zea mays]